MTERKTQEIYPPCKSLWLVWVLEQDDRVELLAIDSSKKMAERHKEYIESGGCGRKKAVWVDDSCVTNHIFASTFRRAIYKLRGEGEG